MMRFFSVVYVIVLSILVPLFIVSSAIVFGFKGLITGLVDGVRIGYISISGGIRQGVDDVRR